MFIVRVDLANGLHLEFNYATRESAELVFTSYERADREWMVEDEEGSISRIPVVNIVHVMLCDLEKQVRAQVRTGMITEKWKQEEVEATRARLFASQPKQPKLIVPGGMLGGIRKN